MNDTLGHLAGDTVLVEIAKRLKECVRDSDMCCRIGGGDEFTVILKKIKDKQSLEKTGKCHDRKSLKTYRD